MDCYQTLNSFLKSAHQKLLKAGVASPRLDTEVLMAQTLNMSRAELMTHLGSFLTCVEAENFISKIERRVLREPVSYITGVQEFWSLEFAVDEKVLIPRPETETLIEQCLKALRENSSPVRVLDLGSGSGILAIVLAKEIPQSQIVAIEKSFLDVARRNALHHSVADQVCFISADLVEADWQGPYHLIVSNPPYLKSEELLRCMPEVRQYEPIEALDGGQDGLDYYRFIVPMALDELEENGLLALEINHTQADAVVALMKNNYGYHGIQVVQDYSGFDRVVLARKRKKNG